jgi:nicotinamide-nucleotide amidase
MFDKELLLKADELVGNKEITFSFAESCTGGLASAIITTIPGVSTVFSGAVVTYSNQSKIELLGVPKDLIENYGAVSKRVAASMAKMVLKKFKTDLAASITGIAGPDGGSVEKPVGTVHIALSNGELTVEKKFFFRGSREIIQKKAVAALYDSLILFKKGIKPQGFFRI